MSQVLERVNLVHLNESDNTMRTFITTKTVKGSFHVNWTNFQKSSQVISLDFDEISSIYEYHEDMQKLKISGLQLLPFLSYRSTKISKNLTKSQKLRFLVQGPFSEFNIIWSYSQRSFIIVFLVVVLQYFQKNRF